MALLTPGAGNLGRWVTGAGQTAPTIYNGGTETVGQITLPTAGIWLVTVTGWWPAAVSSGNIEVPGICATSVAKYQYSMSGLVRLTAGPATYLLRLTNWSGATVQNVSLAASLNFHAVKVGEL